MRSDFLYLVNELEGRIPEPLMSAKLYHLRNFDQEQAEEIIEKSARCAALPLEKGLSRQVARDLATTDTVLPSELQIVGERLQSKRIYTAQEYRRAGGKESLVHSFLEDVIRASGDQESARLLLRCLISDENTRLTLSLDEISRRTQRGEHAIGRILNIFARSRLVREIQERRPVALVYCEPHGYRERSVAFDPAFFNPVESRLERAAGPLATCRNCRRLS
jgi:hypothetical protein